MKKEKIAAAAQRLGKIEEMIDELFFQGNELCSMNESTKRVDHVYAWYVRRRNKLIKRFGMELFHEWVRTLDDSRTERVPDLTDEV